MLYHDVLGVSEEATDREIQRAYRLLVLQYHPDKNKSLGAAEKFREIVKAYNYLLSRKPEEKLQARSSEKRGSNLVVSIPVTILDLTTCSKKTVKIKRKGLCPDCDATGSQARKSKKCTGCAGTGLQGLALAMGQKKRCLKCDGAGRVPEPPKCPTCRGSGLISETIQHQIELNPYAEIITIAGMGNCCVGGTAGNLVVELEIKKHPLCTLSGLDIARTVTLSPAQAILGDTITLQVLERDMTIRIPQGVQNNQVVEYEGGGVHYNGRSGKFKARINIAIPQVISVQEEEHYKQLIKIEKESLWPKVLKI